MKIYLFIGKTLLEDIVSHVYHVVWSTSLYKHYLRQANIFVFIFTIYMVFSEQMLEELLR